MRRIMAEQEIEMHRQEHIAETQAVLQYEYEADIAERYKNEEEFKAVAEHEAQLAVDTRMKARTVFDKHMTDIDVHANEVAAARDKLLQERLSRETQLQRQEDMFHNFTSKTINRMKENGVTELYAMNKAAAQYDPHPQSKPRPALPTIDTRRRGNPYPNNTKKRIGFMW